MAIFNSKLLVYQRVYHQPDYVHSIFAQYHICLCKYTGTIYAQYQYIPYIYTRYDLIYQLYGDNPIVSGAPRGPRLLLCHGARQRDAALGRGHPQRAGGDSREAADLGGIPRRPAGKMVGLKPEKSIKMSEFYR